MSPEQRPPLWEVMRSASEEAWMDPVAPGSDYAAKIRAVRNWLTMQLPEGGAWHVLLTAEAERARWCDD